MRKKLIFLVLLLSFILVGCSPSQWKDSSSKNETAAAKKVVKNYFKYYNNKDKEALLTTVSEKSHGANTVWGFDDLKNIKLVFIDENTDESIYNDYFSSGSGSVNGISPENVKIFNVKFNVQYKKDSIFNHLNGFHYNDFILIRKDKDSPWVIDDFGPHGL